jgi:hypothetical protein
MYFKITKYLAFQQLVLSLDYVLSLHDDVFQVQNLISLLVRPKELQSYQHMIGITSHFAMKQQLPELWDNLIQELWAQDVQCYNMCT